MIKPNKPLCAGVLTRGFLFLYSPIVSLVVYSFNESKLVTVWSG
ncbi:putrescine ABC transporter permease PotI, partial [Burkholderia pseudomallei]